MNRFFRTQIATQQTPEVELQRLLSSLHPVCSPRDLIRLGPSGDGGYLLPDDLEGITEAFSPGVSTECGFEMDCAQRGIVTYMADGTVDSPARQHENFVFDKQFVGSRTSNGWISLDDWILAKSTSGADLLLQMDIEGFEYETLFAMSQSSLRRFRIILIEFHYLDLLFSYQFFRVLELLFSRLLTFFRCVHIHPNNYLPPVRVGAVEISPIAEFTFLRTDRWEQPYEFARIFPHSLDKDNVSHKPTVRLPASMWRQAEHSFLSGRAPSQIP